MNNKHFKIGISSWTFPWAIGVNKGPRPEKLMSVFDLLVKTKQLQVPVLQIADNLPLEQLTESELNELAKQAEEWDISIEIGTKGIDVDHLMRFLDIAKKLKSPILRTLPALFGKTAVFDEVKSNLAQVLPAFEKAGIIIVLENTEAFSAAEYITLMEEVNHPNLRLCVDLANALGKMEGPYYVFEQMMPYCANYHFKDIEIIRSPTLMGFSVNGKPSGLGQIPVKWVLNKLKSNNMFPSVIIELWPPLQEDIDKTIELENNWATESVTNLKLIINEINNN
jgi:sugar phosphate isomerase/epimerase